jgi:hypothetical protein
MNIHNFEPHDSYKKIRTNSAGKSPYDEDEMDFPDDLGCDDDHDQEFDRTEDGYED